jgi:peptidoglycan-associated lipoprotein
MKYPNSLTPFYVLAGLLVGFFVLFLLNGCAHAPRPSIKPPGPAFDKVNGHAADAGEAPGGHILEGFLQTPQFPVVYFAFDSDTISSAFREVLAAAARGQKAKWVCNVDGFASSEGTAEYNLALGALRASRVGDYLSAFAGITVIETSYGEERLVPGPPSLSRRVEVRCR